MGRSRVRAGTQIVSFHIPPRLLEALDRLVEEGYYNNRSEAIRFALSLLIHYHRGKVRPSGMMIG